MILGEKIYNLRKANNMSQEELAEKLNVSRQAVSRWEVGSAMPDAMNILGLSKLFGVSADYLLNDEYENDRDIPIVKTTEKNLKEHSSVLSGLNNVFLGLIFMLLSFKFNELEFFPNFVGFLLFVIATGKLAFASDRFNRIYKPSIAMGILYFFDFMLPFANMPGIFQALGWYIPIAIVASVTLRLADIYILYNIIMGVVDIEKSVGQSLNTNKLLAVWKIDMPFLLFLSLMRPFNFSFEGVIAILGIMLQIVLIVFFWQVKEEYKKL